MPNQVPIAAPIETPIDPPAQEITFSSLKVATEAELKAQGTFATPEIIEREMRAWGEQNGVDINELFRAEADPNPVERGVGRISDFAGSVFSEMLGGSTTPRLSRDVAPPRGGGLFTAGEAGDALPIIGGLIGPAAHLAGNLPVGRAGRLAGGALSLGGAVVGGLLGEQLRLRQRTLAGIPSEKELEGFEELKRFARIGFGEAALEIAGVGVGAGLTKLGRGGLRALGVGSEQALESGAALTRAGIEPTIQDVSSNRYIQLTRSILGIFGPTNKFFVNQKKREITRAGKRVKQVIGSITSDDPFATAKILDGNHTLALAPHVSTSLDLTRAGRDLAGGGRGYTKWFKETSDGLYKAADDAALAAGGISVPTTRTATAAQEMLAQMTDLPRRRVRINTPEGPREGLELIRNRLSDSQQIAGLLDDVSQLEAQAGYRQMRNLRLQLGNAFTVAGERTPLGRQVAVVLNALDRDFAEMSAPEGVKRLYRQADIFYKSNRRLLTREIASIFSRTNPNFGRSVAIAEGMLSEDKLAVTIFKQGTPEAISDLNAIMARQGARGREVYRRAAQAYLGAAFDDSLVKGKAGLSIFEVNEIRKFLGLDKPQSAKAAATRQLLRTLRVPIKDFETFLKGLDEAFGEGVPDINTMAARRFALGGLGSAARMATGLSVTGGAGVLGGPGGVVGALGALLFMRRLSKTMTDPKALQAANSILTGTGTRRQWLRLRRVAMLTGGVRGLNTFFREQGIDTEEFDIETGKFRGDGPRSVRHETRLRDTTR